MKNDIIDIASLSFGNKFFYLIRWRLWDENSKNDIKYLYLYYL